MSQINLNGNTKLFKILTVSAGALLDPYQIDSTGNHIEKYEWDNGKIGRLVSSNFSLGTSLHSKQGQSNKPKTSKAGTEDELDYINSHPDAYIDFNIPWNLNINYNFYYTKTGITKNINQSLSFNGDVNLTSKWRVGISSGFDLETQKFTFTSLNVYRDLHCWEMRFNVIPFGFRQSFSVDINVKSAVLKDLKLHKTKPYQDYLNTQ
jgi:hypothetical protein